MGYYPKQIEKNDMKVSWEFEKDVINIRLSAPTQGWIAIGFNEVSGLKGNYLLMARVVEGKAELVEHFVFAPGDYQAITKSSPNPKVIEVSGQEENGTTDISFSLKGNFSDEFRKSLVPKKDYHLLMAYSVSDNFKHHSRMRTSIKIRL
ncbi:MAG: DOMON domain-containing protein [Bacteroidia bacterium]|nr:DOMON domain-containing protein [Bacteroidia bacterium]